MSAVFILLIFAIILAIAAVTLVAQYRIFQRAGKPGWACIVPFYEGWVLAEIGGKPGWWGLVMSFLGFNYRTNSQSHPNASVIIASILVALIALAFSLQINIGVAKNFGKSTGFGVLLTFLPFIGYPILAFSQPLAEYHPVSNGANNTPTAHPDPTNV